MTRDVTCDEDVIRDDRSVRLAVGLSGAVIWLGLLLVRLLREDRSLWIARDDAVITLSHARNLVEFGTIGVSPVGDRVEGYSSPVHAFVAAALTSVRAWDAATLTMVILVAAVAVCGWCVADLFAVRSGAGACRWPAPAVIVATGAAGLLVAASWTTTGWIGSGMENPIVIGAGLAIAATVARAGGRWSRVVGSLALAVFALSRIDLVAFAVPIGLVMLWSEVEASRDDVRRGLRRGSIALAAAVGVVVSVHLWRRWYFGSWLPNTAVAQDRFQGASQVEAIVWVSVLLSVPALVRIGRRLGWTDRLRAAGRLDLVSATARVVLVVVVARLLWLVATDRLPGDPVRLAALMPVLVLVSSVVALAWVAGRDPRRRPVDWVLVTIAAAPAAQYVVMGPARMDEFRVASLTVPPLAVLVSALAGDVAVAARAAATERTPSVGRVPLALLGVGLLLAVGVTAWRDGPRYLQWEIAYADEVVAAAERFGEEHLGPDVLPILANPDLGKVSYAKSVVVVDLGLLGDPALAAVADSAPELVDSYLATVAVPDLVELHGSFTCRFEPWVVAASYRPAEGAPAAERRSCDGGGATTIWERTGGDDEYALAARLARSDDPVAEVVAAVEGCRGGGDDVWRCGHVRRSILRAAVVLRESGRYDEVVAAMSASPSWALDEPMLRRGPGWGDQVADAYVRLEPKPD